MRRACALFVLFAAGCDPAWGVSVELRDPGDIPVAGATLALACTDSSGFQEAGMAIKTDGNGNARIGGIGGALPRGCDIYIVKPGLAPLRIPYRKLCPNEDHCERGFSFSIVVSPCQPVSSIRDRPEPSCRGYSQRLRFRQNGSS